MARPDLRDLVAAVVLTALALLALALPPAMQPLRVLFTAPLALALPGYALSAALLPERLGRSERLALSVGLSLAVASLGGLLLNLAPDGLHTAGWAALLAAVTLVATGVAYARRRGRAVTQAPPGVRISPRDIALLGSAALVMAGAFAVAGASAARQPAGFTQLWLLPEGATSAGVRLGVDSKELGTVTYRLTVQQGATMLRQWPSITLGPGGQWTGDVALPQAAPTPAPIDVDLYRAGSATPYRHVQWWPASRP